MKKTIIRAAVLSAVCMSASVFAANESGTLTIDGKISSASCKFEDGSDSIKIQMPTVSASEFTALNKFAVYDGAVGITTSAIKISCDSSENVELSFTTPSRIAANNKAIASNNDTVGYYLYVGKNDDAVDISLPVNIKSYGDGKGNYTIPFSAKYLKLVEKDATVDSGNVNSTLTMKVFHD